MNTRYRRPVITSSLAVVPMTILSPVISQYLSAGWHWFGQGEAGKGATESPSYR
jgi:hypothetical protein